MSISQVRWIIDDYLITNNPLYQKIYTALDDLGIEYHKTKYIPFSDEQDYGPYSSDDCVVLYGTVGLISKCKIPFVPGAYGFTQNRNFNVYVNHIPSDWLLNSDFVMTTYGDLKKNPDKYYEMFDSDNIFLRPNSGDKTFAGQTLRRGDFEFEINSLNQVTSVVDETIIVVAKAKEIKGEFRFIVGDKRVISGSEYRWNNILDVRSDYDPDCYELAKKVARLDFQLDRAYSVDICLTKEGPKVVELNSFACCGWYACDYRKVIIEISEIAWKELNDG